MGRTPFSGGHGNKNTRNQTPSNTYKGATAKPPKQPGRKWYQYLPFLSKGYDDELAKYQNEYNLMMWEKEKKYNTPSSQLKRYRQAGLSTAMMYGQGTPGNASQPKAAEANKGNVQSMDVISKLMSYVQMDKIRADTEYTKSKTATEGVNFDLAFIRKQLTDAMFQDFTSDMEAKDAPISELEAMLRPSPRSEMWLSKSQTATAKASIDQSEAEMREQMVKWLTSNQLAKWIPILGPILSTFFQNK